MHIHEARVYIAKSCGGLKGERRRRKKKVGVDVVIHWTEWPCWKLSRVEFSFRTILVRLTFYARGCHLASSDWWRQSSWKRRKNGGRREEEWCRSREKGGFLWNEAKRVQRHRRAFVFSRAQVLKMKLDGIMEEEVGEVLDSCGKDAKGKISKVCRNGIC